MSDAAEDYVNDAYIELTEEEKEITSDALFYKCRSKIIDKQSGGRFFISKATTRWCCKCKEDLPVACFRLRYFKNLGRHYFDSPCNECRRKMNKKNYKRIYENTRDNLTDGYIRSILRKMGIKKITQESIEERRLIIKKKRSVTAEGKRLGKSNTKYGRYIMMNWYVDAQLKERGIPITETSRAKYRERLTEKRIQRALKEKFPEA